MQIVPMGSIDPHIYIYIYIERERERERDYIKKFIIFFYKSTSWHVMICVSTLILVVRLCKIDVVSYHLTPQKVVNNFLKKVVSFIIGLNLFLVID